MNVNIKTISSSEDMISFGQELGNSLKGGEVIELIGDVGAGKTTFTKGLAKSLGITDEIQSPTFTISRVYEGTKNNLVHYDFYRLNDKRYAKELNRDMAKNILAFIKEVIEENGDNLNNLTGICVFSGPGSFTGLRIGITVANSLADGLNIPIVSVSGEYENWYSSAKEKLLQGQNEKLVMPIYGKEANITKPRK